MACTAYFKNYYMSYTIQSPFGRIDYYNDYGFDCIAQYSDKEGIMFGNYTKERIELTPDSSNMVAVFRITKRKIKQFILNNGVPINIGEIVFYVANSGLAGIFKYQYIGIITNSFDNIKYHIFISEHMVGILFIKVGGENRSISYGRIFHTLKEATMYKITI